MRLEVRSISAFRRAFVGVLAAIATCAFSTGAASADEITRAKLRIDATQGTQMAIDGEFVWTAEGRQPRTTLELYLAQDVTITRLTAEGRELTLASEPVAGSHLRKWTALLGVPIPSGTSRTLEFAMSCAPAGMAGIRAGENGGYLLPGSGWFPSTTPWSSEHVTHSTSFQLPAGWSGIAAGTRPDGAGEMWTTTTAARPFAAWGPFERVDRTDEHPDGTTTFEVYRRVSSAEDEEAFASVARIVDHLRTGLGEESGFGSWKLVDVGEGVVAGGSRTIFWDESAFQGASGAARQILERDVAGAAAASFWSEHFEFHGELAAWLSSSFDRHIGDLAAISLDPSDERTPTEARIIGSRRSAFAQGQSEDRALRGLVPFGPVAAWCLETRGTLLAHLAAEAAPSRTGWMEFLASARQNLAGRSVDWEAIRAELAAVFPNQHTFLTPLLDTTDLPDFRITDHAMQETKMKPRYRVDVENVGTVASFAEISTFSPGDHLIRTSRVMIEPGAKRSVLFEVDHLARIELDPRGVTPQLAYDQEQVRLMDTVNPGAEEYVPAFPFEGRLSDTRAIEDFDLELAGITLRDFSGYFLPYSTHHGPTGGCLFGSGEVEIRPTEAKLSRSFHEAFGTTSLSFVGSELWIRFPLSAWSKIEPQLRGRVDGSQALEFRGRQHQIYSFSFPTGFSDGSRARIPAPGNSLVLFTDQAGERRGYLHEASADGKTRTRYWDHLHNETLWEETQ